MGLKQFLQEQGFIAKDGATGASETGGNNTGTQVNSKPPVPLAPVIFPTEETTTTSGNDSAAQPHFVQDLPNPSTQQSETIDAAFIKFYEDEIAKVNLPGPDYYEFRQQMIAMHQKMANKGVTPELILQAVLTSFEAQNIPASKLADGARFYKAALNDKKDSFLQGAAAEKNNQLQKRAGALQTHQSNMDAISARIRDLQTQLRQLEESLAKEKTQMEVDKTMGKEGIEKIERAERQITLAHTFMTNAIDKDITLLQSS